MTNNVLQGQVQASLEAATGTGSNFYNDDWELLWDQIGIANGMWNERMLLYINAALGTHYNNLPAAQQAMADYYGVSNWSSLGVTPGKGFDVVLRQGATNSSDTILRPV